jgi:ubiquinone/menaquinone biosynthesis C-methylase UbiE
MVGVMTTEDWREANRAMWDERVPIHAASAFYDQDAFRSGRDEIRAFEAAEVGDVTGKRLLHLQCHMGQDTLSWARRGADRVVGLDFSESAVTVARGLAAEVGLADRAEFVAADVYDAVSAVPDADYDIVYTGLGALVWLPDIRRWAEAAAALVAPGGFLYVAEFHPITDVLDSGTGLNVIRDYFRSEPIVFDQPGSYADFDAQTVDNLSYEWVHPIGEVVSAIAAAGLRIEFLHEHPFTLFQRFGSLEKAEDGTFRQPPSTPQVPLLYSLKASRPA